MAIVCVACAGYGYVTPKSEEMIGVPIQDPERSLLTCGFCVDISDAEKARRFTMDAYTTETPEYREERNRRQDRVEELNASGRSCDDKARIEADVPAEVPDHPTLGKIGGPR